MTSPVARRPLGNSGIEVPVLGLGTGALGEDRLTDEDADALVAAALDRGICLFDTARSYGHSEERLGRILEHRRGEVVLVTKGGYGVDGAADWTGDGIRLAIERALHMMRTDHLDVFLLHSCPMGVLLRDEVVDALEAAKVAGKIRCRGYSGENEELAWAVTSGYFDVVECSVSLFDRGSLEGPVAEAARRGLGVLAKRPLGNAPWRFERAPEAEDVRASWDRAETMKLDPAPLSFAEAAIRFAAFAPGVSCALVGTSSVAHLEAAASAAARGALEPRLASRFEESWKMHATPAWRGIV